MSCESTNELIRRSTYDIIVITSMWGLILHTNLDMNKYGNNYNAKREFTTIVLLLSGIFSTAICAYKYSK